MSGVGSLGGVGSLSGVGSPSGVRGWGRITTLNVPSGVRSWVGVPSLSGVIRCLARLGGVRSSKRCSLSLVDDGCPGNWHRRDDACLKGRSSTAPSVDEADHDDDTQWDSTHTQ